jgi:hypothetical protein
VTGVEKNIMTKTNRKTSLGSAILTSACLCGALLLSGCTVNDIQAENHYVPYSGSDKFPITVANGKASTKPCGDWSEDVTSTFNNTTMKNHGCAVQHNIAAMIAHPNDINHPADMGPALTASRTPAIHVVDDGGNSGGGATGSAGSAGGATN